MPHLPLPPPPPCNPKILPIYRRHSGLPSTCTRLCSAGGSLREFAVSPRVPTVRATFVSVRHRARGMTTLKRAQLIAADRLMLQRMNSRTPCFSTWLQMVVLCAVEKMAARTAQGREGYSSSSRCCVIRFADVFTSTNYGHYCGEFPDITKYY